MNFAVDRGERDDDESPWARCWSSRVLADFARDGRYVWLCS